MEDDRLSALARLGETVRERRELLSASQKVIAEMAGIGLSTLQGIERGNEKSAVPEEPTQEGLERALGWAKGSCIRVLRGDRPELDGTTAAATQRAAVFKQMVSDVETAAGRLYTLRDRVRDAESDVEHALEEQARVVHVVPPRDWEVEEATDEVRDSRARLRTWQEQLVAAEQAHQRAQAVLVQARSRAAQPAGDDHVSDASETVPARATDDEVLKAIREMHADLAGIKSDVEQLKRRAYGGGMGGGDGT